MNELSEEDVRIRQAMSRETATVPTVVREKMERLYAALPELAEDRRRYARRRKWSLGASIALLLAIVVTAGLATPTASDWLRQLQGIGSGFATSGSATKFEKQTVEDQGIKLTLSQVLYDGNQLAVGIRHEPGIEIRPLAQMVSLNGTFVSNMTRSQNEEGTETLFTYHKALGTLPDTFDIAIKVNVIVDSRGSGKPQTISGKWEFRTTVGEWKKSIREVTYDPPLRAKAGDTELAVTGMTVSPLTVKLTYELDDPELTQQSWEEKMRSKVKLPKGETVELKTLNVRLFDDRGAELEASGTMGTREDNGPVVYTAYYSLLDPDTNELRLSVDAQYNQLTSNGNGGLGSEAPLPYKDIPLTSTTPLTVELGESSSIVFNRIDLGEYKTIVDYEVKGDYPLGWWVVDEKEGTFHPPAAEDPIRIGNDYSYRIELPAYPDPSKIKIRALQAQQNRTPIPELDMILPIK
ncbi:DUF4179 domain-containing protein [Cohnella thailandensis]|uniref:DUF4179 domain-containing protein n=1 Tax=Cohnella thailandensis TaxID=557557 RepID=A0A841SVE1_9BACL|nr:DUF4179 domain-containing protein [Cohnella thailandensis]MBB6635222.1 DUF4179 domain-containing protein [Cohnella thailandensis]MBP1974311.1 hypothetical protein [Cohnella thailandensis]